MAQQFPPTGPTTIQNVIPSYLYVQYQDDDNLQAMVEAYNIYAQAYLTYLNGLNLPIWSNPKVVGSLLDWVALGIYGFTRPVFSNPGTAGQGPFNTWQFNSITFNTATPGQASGFTLASDDIFKRVLTWHLYKGDGKVFNVSWLKRRVARFLFGLDGTNPLVNPYLMSVTITGPAAATITVPDNFLGSVFQQGVAQGVLELPFQIDWTITLSSGYPADYVLDADGFPVLDADGDPVTTP